MCLQWFWFYGPAEVPEYAEHRQVLQQEWLLSNHYTARDAKESPRLSAVISICKVTPGDVLMYFVPWSLYKF